MESDAERRVWGYTRGSSHISLLYKLGSHSGPLHMLFPSPKTPCPETFTWLCPQIIQAFIWSSS